METYLFPAPPLGNVYLQMLQITLLRCIIDYPVGDGRRNGDHQSGSRGDMEENALRYGHRLNNGSRTTNVVPSLSVLSKRISPRWSSTQRRTIINPSPVPGIWRTLPPR